MLYCLLRVHACRMCTLQAGRLPTLMQHPRMFTKPWVRHRESAGVLVRCCGEDYRMNRVPNLVASLFLMIAAGGCDSSPVASTGGPALPAVTVAAPLKKTITEWDEYTGRFTAVETVEVRARVSGFIDSVHFKEGQIVKQGD